jgi:hypothetical protein
MTYSPSAPRFLNPNKPLQAALAALPGYDEHAAATAALQQPLREADAARERATEGVKLTGSVLAEILLKSTAAEAPALIEAQTTEAIKAEDELWAAKARFNLINRAEYEVGAGLDNIIRGGRDQVLRHLDRTLKDAYKKSRALGLQGIHDADEAITAGKADEWRAMLELRTIVFQVRDAQVNIISRLGSHDAFQRVRTFGTLENYAELWPGWLEGARGPQWGRQGTTPPWPTDKGEADPAELHAWILNNPQAEPWVPTEAQLLNAVKTAQTEARAAAHAAHVGQDA